jgi:methyl-accepting chemotaxis protein
MGISQINVGVTQVSQVVQTNAATAEESAAASEELSSQAEILKQMVGNFRLKNTTKKLAGEPRLLEAKAAKREETVKAKPAVQQIILNDSDYDKY